MNKKGKRLKRYSAYLSTRIKEIQSLQDELILQNILLLSRREELEIKYNQVECLISKQQSDCTKQAITTQFNDSVIVLFLN